MLQFLDFDTSISDDGTHTWEAMASVQPARWPALWQEAMGVLTQVQHLLPHGPLPLDEGGDWDVLLQVQLDDTPPHTLPWPSLDGHGQATEPSVTGISPSTRWLALTLTLAACEAQAHTVATLFLSE